MSYYLLLSRSITHAQRMSRTLERAGSIKSNICLLAFVLLNSLKRKILCFGKGSGIFF